MRVSGLSRRSPVLQLEQLESRELLNGQSPLAAVVPEEPTSLIVRYRSEASPVKIDVPSGHTLADTLAAYRADPNVLYAEANQLLQTQQLPNDPDFGKVWNLNNTGQAGVVDADVDAPEAWDITTGSTRTVVAVIDTGIDYTHRDLYLNIWVNQGEIPAAIRSRLTDIDNDGLITLWDLNDTRNQGAGKIVDVNKNGRIDGGDLIAAVKADGTGGWANGISEDGDKYVDDLIGWNFVDNNNNPYDWNNHGTHIAGTIGAIGNDGYGISGVNWKIQMMDLRFSGASGTGTTLTAIEALNYAVAKGATVSNNSWAGGPQSQALYDAIDAARQKGHIFVAAAGNGGADGVGDNIDAAPIYPASYNLSNILVVAATTHNNKISAFTNYGVNTVDLAAPGYLIYSTIPGGKYTTYSGTSMAVPHVVGTLALLKSAHPDWTYTQLVSQVMNTVDKLATLTGKVASGGRVSAGKALLQAPADQTGPKLVAATTNASGANPVSSVRVTFSEPMKVSSFTTADVASFTGPNGAITVTGIQVVAGSDNKQFDVLFGTQSTPGTYTLVLGPQITDEAGNPMDQNGDGLKASSVDKSTITFAINPVSTFNATGLPLSLRDAGSIAATLTINEDITIADLNVKVNISHTYNQDLYIHLRGPDGTDVVLINRRGGSGDNFNNTILDDEASTPISAGRAPYTGTFRPETSLSAFDGKLARGTWQLIIEDRQTRDTGKLNAWSLTIEASAGTMSVQSLAVSPAAPVSLHAPTAPTAVATTPAPAVSIHATAVAAALPRSDAPLATFISHTAPRVRSAAAQQLAVAASSRVHVTAAAPTRQRSTTRATPTLSERMDFFTRLNRV